MDGVNRTVNRFFGAGCILDVKQAVVGETDQAAGRLWGECTIGRGESLLAVLACAGEGSGSESALSRMGKSYIGTYGLMIPLRIAYFTSSVRECRLSLRIRFSRWRATVFGLMERTSAIS